jgi:hypothetical protein
VLVAAPPIASSPRTPCPGVAQAGKERANLVKKPDRKTADTLLAELADARGAEQVVLTFLARVRKEIVSAVLAAKAAGVGYDRMALATLRGIRARNRTVSRREREAARLRKLVQRQRVTAGHGYEKAPPFELRSEDSGFMGKVGDPMEQKLIKRTSTTVEETFTAAPDNDLGGGDDLDDRDEVEGDDDADEDDSAARRRRR